MTLLVEKNAAKAKKRVTGEVFRDPLFVVSFRPPSARRAGSANEGQLPPALRWCIRG